MSPGLGAVFSTSLPTVLHTKVRSPGCQYWTEHSPPYSQRSLYRVAPDQGLGARFASISSASHFLNWFANRFKPRLPFGRRLRRGRREGILRRCDLTEGCANNSPLQSTLCGANLGTRRFQRAAVAGCALKSNGATRRDCALEATRTRSAFPVSSQASFRVSEMRKPAISYAVTSTPFALMGAFDKPQLLRPISRLKHSVR